jgi:hypothetical protein
MPLAPHTVDTRFRYALLFSNHRDTEKCSALKSEIQNPKHETNTKSEFSNVQNISVYRDLSCVSVIWILVIRICFGFLLRSPTLRAGSQFRYSDFGFTLALCLCGKSSIMLRHAAAARSRVNSRFWIADCGFLN